MLGLVSVLNFNDFVNGFYKINRGEQFSHEALAKLFDYYNEFSSELNSAIEFDPIAICCEWAESTKKDIIADHDLCESEDPTVFLGNLTMFYELDNGKILYQQF